MEIGNVAEIEDLIKKGVVSVKVINWLDDNGTIGVKGAFTLDDDTIAIVTIHKIQTPSEALAETTKEIEAAQAEISKLEQYKLNADKTIETRLAEIDELNLKKTDLAKKVPI